MQSSILFSHSYFMRFDPKQWQWMQPYPPLATIQAAAAMRDGGHDVALHDVMFASSPDEVLPAIRKFKPKYFVIYDDGFNYLTKMCLTNMREAAWTMAAHARQQGCYVVVSGSDSTDHCMEYLSAGADVVIIGEAEQTLADLIAAIDSGISDLSTIAGVAFMKDSNVYKTPPRPVMRELDALPLPAWDMIDMDEYKKRWENKWGYFSLNIATTRGCPYKCNWCAKPIYGNAYNMRSPSHVLAEIKLLIGKYKADHIWFCDDIFGMRRNWVIEFADLVEREGLKFRYKIQSRADLLIQERYVEALAASGCEIVWMGAESGSDRILNAMDKGVTTADIRKANSLLKTYHIKTAFFLQFGYPGETMEDIEMTMYMLNDCLPDDLGVSISYPLPGTAFYESVKNELQKKTNWSDSDEMALMFKGTYPAAFYKQLPRYVHKTYRKHQGFDSVHTLFKSPGMATFAMMRRIALLAYYIPGSYLEKRKLDASWK